MTPGWPIQHILLLFGVFFRCTALLHRRQDANQQPRMLRVGRFPELQDSYQKIGSYSDKAHEAAKRVAVETSSRMTSLVQTEASMTTPTDPVHKLSGLAYCTLAVKGVASLRQSDPNLFENATLDFYNPTIGPIQTKHRGRKVSGSLRLSVTSGQDCNTNQNQTTIGKVGFMHQRSSLSRALKRQCMKANLDSYGLSRWSLPASFRDLTVSGWLDLESCDFTLDPLSSQAGIDAKDYVLDDASVVQAPVQVRQMSKYVHVANNVTVKADLTYLYAGSLSGTLILFDGSSGPCWRGCTEPIPSFAIKELCGTEYAAADLERRKSSDARPAKRKEAKEKNMSPFVYNGQTHFVYLLTPLVICAVDSGDIVDHPQCLMCKGHAAGMHDVWDPIAMNPRLGLGLAAMGIRNNIVYHGNGVQLLSLPANSGLQGFLGVAHAIHQEHMNADTNTIRYGHFLFLLSPEMPFSVMNVSAPLPLGNEISTALYWFEDASNLVEVTFVSGMSLVPSSQNGTMELMITYGAGDDEGRLLRMPWSAVLRLFGHDPVA